ncbi:F0F1 ATP synthase subunit B [uncultured Thiodictyon sp.]|uniref:F0F1 ATP synthase subunit B n=1 Tax=uncultured Thiodictyon sp. TaxID=1846217 RepID=UPI0025F5FFFB|nr:F0F1 ATP synthase subunit B [uncultured Thiodictyon sp.]
MNFNLTLIGQMISFGVFVWFTMTYVWTPIIKALQERKAKIAEGLAAAERGHQEKALGEQRALQLLKDAKSQAADILGQAQKRAGEIVEEAKVDARAEGQRLVVSAQAEIEHETNRAREELRGKVATLAVAAAEKILKKEIDARAHQSIVDDFVRQI